MSNPAMPRELSVGIKVFKDGGIFVSCCPVLDVYSQGNTVGEAETNIAEALSAFIGSCQRRGTLHQVLEESGLLLRDITL